MRTYVRRRRTSSRTTACKIHLIYTTLDTEEIPAGASNDATMPFLQSRPKLRPDKTHMACRPRPFRGGKQWRLSLPPRRTYVACASQHHKWRPVQLRYTRSFFDRKDERVRGTRPPSWRGFEHKFACATLERREKAREDNASTTASTKPEQQGSVVALGLNISHQKPGT